MVNAALTLSGALSDFTLSDINGDHSFSGLGAGSYTVTPSGAFRYYYPYDAAVVLQDADATGVNFEAHILPSGKVDGANRG